MSTAILGNSRILSVVVLGTAALATAACESESPPAVVAWAAEPLAKILPALEAPSSPGSVDIVAVRNEVESAQIVVRVERDISGAAVTAGPLVRDESDERLPAVEVRVVGTTYLSRNSGCLIDPVQTGEGEYPDPLLPTSVADLSANSSQAFWLTVEVPSDASAGDYRGVVEVAFDDERVEIPMHVRVVSYTRPEQQRLRVVEWESVRATAADVYGASPEQALELERQTREMQLEYLHNGLRAGVHVAYNDDFAAFDQQVQAHFDMGYQWVQGWLAGYHVKDEGGEFTGEIKIWLPAGGTAASDATEVQEYLAAFLPAFEAHLDEKGWLDKIIISLADEPEEISLEHYRALAALVRSYAPRLIIAEPTWIPAEVVDDIDIPVAAFPPLHDDLALFQSRVAAGQEVWTYTTLNCFGQFRFPSRAIDAPLLRTRLQMWINAKLGARNTGYLHWAWAHWGITDPFAPDEQVMGDSSIIYPDRDGMSFLSSLRLEAQRDGIEDFELLARLREVDPELFDDVVGTVMPTVAEPLEDMAIFHQQRLRVVERLSAD